MVSSNIKELGKYLVQHTRSLIIVLLALLSVTFALLSIGFIFRRLIDSGLGADQVDAIHNSIYLICVLIGIFAAGSFFRSYFINAIALKVVSEVRSDTYNALLGIDITEFEVMKTGDVISRLGHDAEMIGNLIVNFLSFFIRNSIMLSGAVVLMFIHSPKLSLLVLLTIPVLLFPLLKLSKHVRSLSKRVLEEQSILAASIEESFAGIRTLCAYNQQSYVSQQFSKKIATHIKHGKARLKLRSLFFALAISMIAGSITLVIWVGSIDILQGKMTSGEMIAFIYYAIMVGMSAGGLAELFSEIQGPLAALDRVLEVRNMKANIAPISEGNALNFTEGIKYKQVAFSYPSRPDILVLNNISLEIKHGIFTGIVGKSGSGKSTLLQLLLKFYSYQSGNIFIGSKDIELVGGDLVRSKIAYVEQSPTIFSGSIRSNITFSNPNAGDDEIAKIAKICGISDFANQLEFGLDTEIGEKGVRLSGGQKQRIAIARALIYNPEILLLDEATSALDSDSENQLLYNVRKLLNGKTIVSIAHRISSIENADEILIIDQGRLAGQGTHEHLLKTSKVYNTLHKEQL
ncbi:MAG: ABC transporter transmembrane domain-containing protein [Rickettsiaceae bacterium]